MIIITGLPLFAKRLAEDLQSVDPFTRYIALDTYYSRKDKLKFLLLLPFAEKVISMNGVSDQSTSLDYVLKFRKKLVLQWMGTDILFALERSKKGTISRKYIDYAQNYCDSPWMREELKEAGIHAEILHFKYAQPKFDIAEKYDGISVLSYVAKNRETFYGLERILDLAAHFPAIPFEIIGTKADSFQLPGNVKASGWVTEDEAAKKMLKSAIFLRLPEHDGFSASVSEALSYGAEVLWTFPFPPAVFVDGDEDLRQKFAQAVKKIEERSFQPNFENAKLIRNNFTREAILSAYVKTIKEQ